VTVTERLVLTCAVVLGAAIVLWLFAVTIEINRSVYRECLADGHSRAYCTKLAWRWRGALAR
jgi:hypothetical protein